MNTTTFKVVVVATFFSGCVRGYDCDWLTEDYLPQPITPAEGDIIYGSTIIHFDSDRAGEIGALTYAHFENSAGLTFVEEFFSDYHEGTIDLPPDEYKWWIEGSVSDRSHCLRDFTTEYEPISFTVQDSSAGQ